MGVLPHLSHMIECRVACFLDSVYTVPSLYLALRARLWLIEPRERPQLCVRQLQSPRAEVGEPTPQSSAS